MRHLQDSLDDERRKLSNARDALAKEMQLTKQLKEKLSFEKLLKSEVERELEKSKASLAEVRKANEALQQELRTDKRLMYETANKSRDLEDEARQNDKVSDELISELDTLRGNCVQREEKQCTGAEKLAKSKTLIREKDEEVNTVVTRLAAEKICVEEATTVEVVVGEGANLSKNDDVKSEVEGAGPVDDVNFLAPVPGKPINLPSV